MALAAQQKSTLVRAKIWLDRLGFRSADLIAPAVAGRFARDLWFAAPPRMPAGPVPKGGRPFTVRSLGGTIRGHVWTPTDDIAPVVYLVHGWGGRGTQFATHVQPLVEAGFRVVMFDAPAHGDSDRGPHGHLTNGVEFGRALDAVFAKFGPAHAVVAHSLGAI